MSQAKELQVQVSSAELLFSGSEDLELYSKNFPSMVNAVLNECFKRGEPAQNEPCHRFADGIYARELFIAKNELIVGKRHKTEHFNIISKGDISIATKDGVMRVQAPYTFKSAAGIQKVVYAHEDTVWTTIHATTETDIPALEKSLAEEELLA